jgi:hypothetical protein
MRRSCLLFALVSAHVYGASFYQGGAFDLSERVNKDQLESSHHTCLSGMGTDFVDWQANGVFKFADTLINAALQPMVLNKLLNETTLKLVGKKFNISVAGSNIGCVII